MEFRKIIYKRTLIAILTAVLVVCSHYSNAQKKLIEEYPDVVSAATTELDSLMKEGSKFQLQAAKMNISGEFEIEITIYGKGEVLTVHLVSANTEDVQIKNNVKDIVRSIRFNFKMPMSKNYKFNYKFKFSTH